MPKSRFPKHQYRPNLWIARRKKERWENDLRQAISLNVEHISAYHLIYEEDTDVLEIGFSASVNCFDGCTGIVAASQ